MGGNTNGTWSFMFVTGHIRFKREDPCQQDTTWQTHFYKDQKLIRVPYPLCKGILKNPTSCHHISSNKMNQQMLQVTRRHVICLSGLNSLFAKCQNLVRNQMLLHHSYYFFVSFIHSETRLQSSCRACNKKLGESFARTSKALEKTNLAQAWATLLVDRSVSTTQKKEKEEANYRTSWKSGVNSDLCTYLLFHSLTNSIESVSMITGTIVTVWIIWTPSRRASASYAKAVATTGRRLLIAIKNSPLTFLATAPTAPEFSSGIENYWK
jgi:hypothetical protein